jgi:gliding motility-associated lipoprotein GldB
MRFFLISLLFIGFFSACKKDKCLESPDTSGIEVNVEIERLDLELGAIENAAEMEGFLSRNPLFADQYLRIGQYPDQSIIADQFYQRISHSAFDTLFLEVKSTFGDMRNIEQQFIDAFKIIKYHYPNFRIPKIQTTVTGFVQDNYLSDSLIIIGLEYYLGRDASFRPELPEYILKRYQKEYMVPQLMVVHFSRLFNRTDLNDQTVLADMIFYGKAYYFARQVMPCEPDSIFTGYTSKEMDEIVEHEEVIWAGVLENELLFHTNHEEKNKIFSERPKTIELGPQCPGRIGRWIGWRIIDEYMKKQSDISLKELMAEGNAKAIFNASGYKPIPY